MKRLNNKGFTLVELLAVIVILVIIMVIAIPNISSSIERSSDKKDKAMEKVLKSEGDLYISKYEVSLVFNSDGKCYVSVGDLIDEGYILREDIEDYENSCLIYDGKEFKFFKEGLSNDFGQCDTVNQKCHSS